MENLIISSSPHVKSQRTTHFFMQDVILALIPVLIAGVVFFSYRALVLVLISVISCVFFEGLYSKLLNKPSTLKDYSAVVTGVTFTSSMPAARKISHANSYQEQRPSFVAWYLPYLSVWIMSTRSLARSYVYVGEPIWSHTTRTLSFFSANSTNV